MKQLRFATLIGFSGLALLAPPLYAHTTGTPATGFANGFAHPLLGLDHMLAMLAVGIWAARMRGNAVWQLPLAFVLALLIGMRTGMSGAALPLVEPLIATSLLVLGLLIALRQRFAPLLAAGLVALFGLFHGHAHGTEMVAAAWSFGFGMIVASLLLHMAGIGIGQLLQRRRALLYRLSGIGLALAGGWLMAGL